MRDTPEGFALAPLSGVSNDEVTGESAVPESGGDREAATPTRKAAAEQPRVPQRRTPPRRKVPSPWAAPGPEGSWWHGGTTNPALGSAPHVPPVPLRKAAPEPAADEDLVPESEVPPAPAGAPTSAPAPAAAPARVVPVGRTPPRQVPARRRRPARRPATGLSWILVVCAAAAFLGWVSAEPLWLAVGRGTAGTATVTGCTGEGLRQRCLGVFVSHTGLTVDPVRLLGVPPADEAADDRFPARMLHHERDTAYVDPDQVVLHLRWVVGWALILLLGVLLVWGSGARRLATAPARRGATLVALAAPTLLGAGFLITGW
ncbi:hypothetical protein [Micromonospora sp. LOL_023]|uniref:hypothetical protein n=1 Tax=Micromonospora sp. LOL_023 TaxID=3345418 RepID=UPI003A8C3886